MINNPLSDNILKIYKDLISLETLIITNNYSRCRKIKDELLDIPTNLKIVEINFAKVKCKQFKYIINRYHKTNQIFKIGLQIDEVYTINNLIKEYGYYELSKYISVIYTSFIDKKKQIAQNFKNIHII